VQNYKKLPNTNNKNKCHSNYLLIWKQNLQIWKQASNSSPPLENQKFLEISSIESVKIIQLFLG
jgi:hypothetical protein